MADLVGATPDGLKSDTEFLTVRLLHITLCDSIGKMTPHAPRQERTVQPRARPTLTLLGVDLCPLPHAATASSRPPPPPPCSRPRATRPSSRRAPASSWSMPRALSLPQRDRRRRPPGPIAPTAPAEMHTGPVWSAAIRPAPYWDTPR